MKKIRQLLIVFLCSLVSILAFGQPATAPKASTDTLQKATYQPVENSLLWAISGKDLKDTSYLYGTIHLIDKEDFFLTEATKKAFNESEHVVFEINIEKMNDLMSQFGLLMKAFMNEGQTLKDFLSEEEYKEVKDHFAEKGITDFLWNMMERIKPMFLTMFASTDLTGENPMTSGEMVSYEMELLAKAQEQEKPIDGLETAEYQMSMFDSIPYEAQAKMLIESIRVDSVASNELDQMVDLYKNQDINGMISMFDEDTEGIGKYEDYLLINRNKNWIPVMSGMMTTQPTFFGVGAGHLAGEFGVVNLLKEAGYTLTPLKDKKVVRKL